MLANTLNTNEIKDSGGVEVEFSRKDTGPGAQTTFVKIGESPALPHRLTVKHVETGNGIKRRRRSVVRFDLTSMSTVDTTVPVTTSGYCVMDIPVGAITANTVPSNVLANLISFIASDGATSTILFAGTGNGAKALLNGDL